MSQKIFITIVITLLSIFSVIAQPKMTTHSKKAKKLFKEAISYYNNNIDNKAIEKLNAAIDKDYKFVEAYLLLADIYYYHSDYDKEVSFLEKVISIDPDYNTKTYVNLGQAYLHMGKYQSALNNLNIYVSKEKNENKLKTAYAYIDNCEFALDAIEHPVKFNPVNMGTNVNTEYNDYMPSLTADEEILVTTVDVPIYKDKPHSQQNSQEDFFISYKINGEWTASRSIGPPLNTKGNEGSQSIMADGNIMVFAACNRKDGKGSCDIYFSRKVGNNWTPAQNIGYPINTEAWESQPSISYDGKTIYFVSNRKGGYGDKDIWMSTVGKDGYWQEPVNLGPNINTPEMDASPFIHQDNQSLYFSSTGHIGMGGFDIFLSKRQADGSFSKPKNLGYPINTYKDEEFLIVNAKGNKAFFSSNRPDSRKKDIYWFNLYDEIRPVPVSYVKGIIYDEDSKQGLSAILELIDLETSETVAKTFSNENTGKYLVCLPTGKNYAFNVSKDQYLFHSENFSLKESNTYVKPYKIDISLSRIKQGKSVVLNNIFFDTDSFNIKPESYPELDKLVVFIRLNIGIKVEIGGHTDNVGSESYNQKLSENRAKSVYNYLISKGVKKERLSYKGYGMKKPLVKNDSPENRAKNRRTEFTII